MDLPRPTPPHRYSPRTGSGFLPRKRHKVLPRGGTASKLLLDIGEFYGSSCLIGVRLQLACRHQRVISGVHLIHGNRDFCSRGRAERGGGIGLLRASAPPREPSILPGLSTPCGSCRKKTATICPSSAPCTTMPRRKISRPVSRTCSTTASSGSSIRPPPMN